MVFLIFGETTAKLDISNDKCDTKGKRSDFFLYHTGPDRVESNQMKHKWNYQRDHWRMIVSQQLILIWKFSHHKSLAPKSIELKFKHTIFQNGSLFMYSITFRFGRWISFRKMYFHLNVCWQLWTNNGIESQIIEKSVKLLKVWPRVVWRWHLAIVSLTVIPIGERS